MFGKERDELARLIQGVVADAVGSALGNTRTGLGKLAQIKKLKEEIEDLTLQKKNREWDYEKKETEIEHKVGLERKRQEFEIEQAKREAIVSVREENLSADKDRFEKQMAFIQKRFEEEVGYLKDIVGKVLSCVEGMQGGGKDKDE